MEVFKILVLLFYIAASVQSNSEEDVLVGGTGFEDDLDPGMGTEDLEGETGADVDPEGETGADVDPEGETGTDVDPEGETEADVDPEGETEADVDPEGETEVDVDSLGVTTDDESDLDPGVESPIDDDNQAPGNFTKNDDPYDSQDSNSTNHNGLESSFKRREIYASVADIAKFKEEVRNSVRVLRDRIRILDERRERLIQGRIADLEHLHKRTTSKSEKIVETVMELIDKFLEKADKKFKIQAEEIKI